uniref:Uncharacterized protein n=1 Tax=Setaria viridis TaxID=4556 RepID=A0A4U6SWL6_SETVI|nr:hypothetical protein SEVIR_9G192000v2 [Setaria viridis]
MHARAEVRKARRPLRSAAGRRPGARAQEKRCAGHRLLAPCNSPPALPLHAPDSSSSAAAALSPRPSAIESLARSIRFSCLAAEVVTRKRAVPSGSDAFSPAGGVKRVWWAPIGRIQVPGVGEQCRCCLSLSSSSDHYPLAASPPRRAASPEYTPATPTSGTSSAAEYTPATPSEYTPATPSEYTPATPLEYTPATPSSSSAPSPDYTLSPYQKSAANRCSSRASRISAARIQR